MVQKKAVVIIRNLKNQILGLLQNNRVLYDLPNEEIKSNEQPVNAALRALNNQINLELNVNDLMFIGEYYYQNFGLFIFTTENKIKDANYLKCNELHFSGKHPLYFKFEFINENEINKNFNDPYCLTMLKSLNEQNNSIKTNDFKFEIPKEYREIAIRVNNKCSKWKNYGSIEKSNMPGLYAVPINIKDFEYFNSLHEGLIKYSGKLKTFNFFKLIGQFIKGVEKPVLMILEIDLRTETKDFAFLRYEVEFKRCNILFSGGISEFLCEIKQYVNEQQYKDIELTINENID